MKKKTPIIVALLLTMVLLTSWIFSKFRLINANQPFIDLSGSVQSAISNAGDAYMEANTTPTPMASPTPEVTQAPVPSATPSPTPMPTAAPEPLDIVVGGSSSGRTVSVAGTECSATDIIRLINAAEHDGIRLIDNWAEYKAYCEVEAVLKENGIEYSSETAD